MTFIATDQYYPQGPFGTTFWGGYWAPKPGIILLDVTGECVMTAEPQGYSTIRLTWSQITIPFDRFLLVRNRFGFPETPSDGIVVLFGEINKTVQFFDNDNNEFTGGFGVTEFLDGGLNPGFYYYSMFISLLQ